MTLDLSGDPRALADALKGECRKMIDANSDDCLSVDMGEDCVLADAPKFAAALLAVLDVYDAVLSARLEQVGPCLCRDIIRAAAAAWLAHGGSLATEREG